MKNLKWIAAAALTGALGGLYLVKSKTHTAPSSNKEHTSAREHTSADEHSPADREPSPPSSRNPIVITQAQELLTTDPTDTDYDPSMLMRVNQADASELFELEMRAEDWAPDFEDYLQQHIHASLADIPADIPIEVECRTATCKVEVNTDNLDDPEAQLVSDYLSYLAPIGPMTQAGTSESNPRHLTIFSALSPGVRSRGGFSDFARDFAEGGGERLQERKKLLIEKLQADKRQ